VPAQLSPLDKTPAVVRLGRCLPEETDLFFCSALRTLLTRASAELIDPTKGYSVGWRYRGRTRGSTCHPVGAALDFLGRGLCLMFNNSEKLRLVNRHVVESRQRLEAQESRAAELVGSGEPIEDATTLLEEARWTLRLMERHREVILWDHARGS
jgi:hypothetical protein